jgi:hypothetical protein
VSLACLESGAEDGLVVLEIGMGWGRVGYGTSADVFDTRNEFLNSKEGRALYADE